MKVFKKSLCLLTAVCLLCVLFSGTVLAAPEAPGVVTHVLAYGDIAVPVFRYTPADFNFRGNNTPVLVVLKDTAFTEESANAYLNEKGFRDIADKESCSVIFASPCFGANWSDSDFAVAQLISAFASDTWYPGVDYSSGIANPYGMYCSGRFRHYYFAEGSAIDFVKKNLDVEGATYPMPEWGVNDAGGFGAGFVYAEDGFTAENVAAGFDGVCRTNRIYLNEGESFLTDYYYWDEYGITETVKSFDSEHFGKIEYYEYVPEGLDVDSATDKYPLVVIFHGAGMHPQAYAQNSAWPIVAAKNGFIVLSVSGPYLPDGSSTITEEMTADTYALITDYIDNHAVDASRVYATGFSMGAARSMALGGKYTETFAAIAPCDPVLDMLDAPSQALPTFFLGGQYDFYGIFPAENDWCGPMLEKLAAANGCSYSYNAEIENRWGSTFDAEEEYTPDGQLATMYVHSLLSEDGNCYTKFCDVSHMSHNVLPYASTVIWDFLKQFSRNDDGTVSVDKDDPCEGYTDIDRGSWYHEAADFVISRGLMSSTRTDDLTFEPTTSCTRSMIVMILYNLAGKPDVEFEAKFPDVKDGKWYTDAVMWAYQNGIVAGYDNGKFGPNDKVTREQLAVVLKGYADLLGRDTSKTADLSKFPDGSKAKWSKAYISWAVAEDLISGKEQDGKIYLDPQGIASRAEVATLIKGFVQNILETK